ncbi:MAG: glycosyltransferase family 2 protein [Nitrososphaerota archaeon]
MRISVVINTLNEELRIERCLNSINRVADEIIVCDDGSIDSTVEIARRYTNKVFHHKSAGFVEKARNFAISKATNPWILILDADEEITPLLWEKLKEISENKTVDYVLIPRKNIIFGKWIKHSGWWPDYNIRFFRKGKVIWQEKIHSQPKTSGVQFYLPADEKFAIIHNNYSTISDFLTKLNRYTNVQASELIETGYHFNWKDLISKPMQEFLARFFLHNGYRDGVHGLILAILQSFSMLVVYAKAWELAGSKPEEINILDFKNTVFSSFRELKFWLFNVLISGKSKTNQIVSKLVYKLFGRLL